MKKALSLIATLLLSAWAFAQTQQGYVKTLGRPDKVGEPLSGVSVRVKGGHNEVLSGSDGIFEMRMDGKKNGEAYALQSVQKAGYELNEHDIVGRQFAFSDKVRLEIVMVSSSVLQAEKRRIEDNAYRTAERNYKAKASQIEQQLQDSAISIQQYRERMAELQDKFEKYQSLIDGLAEHYAHTDYDFLSETDREINICIENGELERADSLINTLFDPIGVLERNMEALARIEQQMSQAQGMLSQANEDMAAVLKQQEKDAEYLYQLYTIALARYDNEKARFYIETRAALDTTNGDWQFDAAFYNHRQNQLDTAETYYQKALTIFQQLALENPQGYEPDIATTMNDLGVLYKNTQRPTESEEMSLRALEIRRRLAKDNPLAYEQDLASTLNNLAILYSITQRFAECETMHLEALEIRRRLAKDDPIIHGSYLAMTLSNLASLYKDSQRFSKSEDLFLEAMEIQKQLSLYSPRFYEPDLAMTLNNLAILYFDTQRYTESEAYYQEALEIRRRLAKNNPQAYEPDLATTLNNLSNLYRTLQHFTESETLFIEALDIYRRLVRNNPQAYEADLASVLNNLAIVYENTNRYEESELLYLEALEINRRLSITNPQINEPALARTLQNLGVLYKKAQRYSESETMYLEALDLYRQLAKSNPSVYEFDLAWMLKNLASLYSGTHCLSESEALYLEALDILRRNTKDNPQAYESELAKTLSGFGLLLIDEEKYQEALAIFEEALIYCRRLVTTDPTIQSLYESSLFFLTYLYPITDASRDHDRYYNLNEEWLSLLKELRLQANNSNDWLNEFILTLGNQSFQCIFVGKLEQAEQYATEALTIDPLQQWIFSSLAASLLFQGKYNEAEEIYGSFKTDLKDTFLQDLAEFEAAGVIPEERKADVERIRRMLNE